MSASDLREPLLKQTIESTDKKIPIRVFLTGISSLVDLSLPSAEIHSSPAFTVRSSICTSPLYRKEGFLKQKYCVERLSARQIAFLIGCSHNVVNRALKKFGLIREPTPSGRPGFEIGIRFKGRFFEPRRKKLIQTMLKMREQRASYRKIAKWLESKGIPAPSGKLKWYAGTVKTILRRSDRYRHPNTNLL